MDTYEDLPEGVEDEQFVARGVASVVLYAREVQKQILSESTLIRVGSEEQRVAALSLRFGPADALPDIPARRGIAIRSRHNLDELHNRFGFSDGSRDLVESLLREGSVAGYFLGRSLTPMCLPLTSHSDDEAAELGSEIALRRSVLANPRTTPADFFRVSLYRTWTKRYAEIMGPVGAVDVAAGAGDPREALFRGSFEMITYGLEDALAEADLNIRPELPDWVLEEGVRVKNRS